MKNFSIEVKNLKFIYQKFAEPKPKNEITALDNISFQISKGELVAIVGENGSGKSTLAKCLNALLIPTEGFVSVNALDTREESNIWQIRSQVAMVFQNPDNQLVSSIVEDDVAFGPENLAIPPEEIRGRVDKALKAVSMYEYRLKGVHTLSGGQKQRVAIAGALALSPNAIIMDEPTSMLDPSGRDAVMQIIQDLGKQGITVVLITHNMVEAALMDRIIVMSHGKIINDATPKDTFRNSALIKKAGLELPPALELRDAIISKGIKLNQDIHNSGELVQAILNYK